MHPAHLTAWYYFYEHLIYMLIGSKEKEDAFELHPFYQTYWLLQKRFEK